MRYEITMADGTQYETDLVRAPDIEASDGTAFFTRAIMARHRGTEKLCRVALLVPQIASVVDHDFRPDQRILG